MAASYLIIFAPQVANLSDVKVGRLNLLTPQRVKASVAEIDTGENVMLKHLAVKSRLLGYCERKT
jgi:hypothetical protein